MQTGIDSIVFQAHDSGLRMAEKIAYSMGGKLQVIKSKPIYPDSEAVSIWRKAGQPKVIPTSLIFAGIIHTPRGVMIPLKQYATSKGLGVEFHGLCNINQMEYKLSDSAFQMNMVLNEFLSSWCDPLRLMQFDRSFDLIGQEWSNYTNSRLHRHLKERKGTSKHKGSTMYYQEPRPNYVKYTAYNKTKKNKLACPVTRLEISFKSQFWKSENYNYDEAIRRTDKYISKHIPLSSIKKAMSKPLLNSFV